MLMQVIHAGYLSTVKPSDRNGLHRFRVYYLEFVIALHSSQSIDPRWSLANMTEIITTRGSRGWFSTSYLVRL